MAEGCSEPIVTDAANCTNVGHAQKADLMNLGQRLNVMNVFRDPIFSNGLEALVIMH
jgi:hypothetical protein